MILVAIVTQTIATGSLEQAEGHRFSAPGECGTPRNDWVCRTRGRVIYWPYDSPETSSGSVVGGRAKALPGLTAVRAEAGAAASIRFRRKAACDLGVAGEPTQVITRVSRESLFYQQFGSTYCRSLNGAFADVSYFCTVTGGCPVVFLSNGTFDSRGSLPSGGARISEATSYRVVITACTGTFELKLFNGKEFETIKEKLFGKARVRITVSGSRDISEGASAESWGYSIRSVSAPGICGV